MAQINEATQKALANFPVMPDEAYVRMPTVQMLFGCSRTSVWRSVKNGKIPAPRKLSARTAIWSVGELRRALAAL